MISDLMNDLRRDEGFRKYVYQDHLGYWTIGYGFLVDKRKQGGIPKHIAEQWLQYIVEQRADALLDRMPWFSDLSDNVQRALINMSYQLGVNGLMGFKKMLKAIERGDLSKAADEALNSKWYRQTPTRAKRVAEMKRNG